MFVFVKKLKKKKMFVFGLRKFVCLFSTYLVNFAFQIELAVIGLILDCFSLQVDLLQFNLLRGGP